MGPLIVCLLALAADKPPKNPVVAMVLRSGAGAMVRVDRDREAQPLRDMDLLRKGYVLKTGKEEARVVFIESGRAERIGPRQEVTVTEKGCDGGGKGAVRRLEARMKPANLEQLRRFMNGQRAGLVVARTVRPEGWPIPRSLTVSGRPTFRWRAVDDAVRYEVRVEPVARGKQKPLWTVSTKKTVLVYPRDQNALKPGTRVRWSVMAIGADGKREKADEPCELTVAGPDLQKKLAQLAPLIESENPDDWLLAAVVYEGEECYTEALAQYERVNEKRPSRRRVLEALKYFYGQSCQQAKIAAVCKRLDELGK